MAKTAVSISIKGPATKKMGCACVHEVQDTMYGKNIRLHNKGNKGYKCVVCQKVK